MKKSLILSVYLVAAFLQPCHALNTVNQQPQPEDSLKFQRIDLQIKELENNFLSYNHLKSGIADNNLSDSTQIYQFNTPGDSVLRERTLFTYDQAGKIKTELQYRWNEFVNRWLEFKYNNTYDRSGKLTEKEYNGWYIEYLQGKGNYSGFIYDKDTTVAFAESRSYLTNYNQLGKPKEIWRFTFDQYDTPVGTWYRCNYDSKGNRTSIDSGWDQPPYIEEYAYDSNNTLLTIIHSRFIQYNYIALRFCSSKIKYEYTYDSNNRVSNIQSYYFSFKANEWRNVSKVDYSYQDNGALYSRLYSIIDTTRNELMPADRSDFKYNKNNKVQLRKDYIWNKSSSQWEICQKQYYYYNSTDPMAKLFENSQALETPLRIFPNPARDILWIVYTEDAYSLLYIYNNKGQCVKTGAIEKGMNSINLYSLPKGIYFYKISLKNRLNSGPLIVE